MTCHEGWKKKTLSLALRPFVFVDMIAGYVCRLTVRCDPYKNKAMFQSV